MPDAPHLRAGDADRDRTAKLLEENFAEGRLSAAELDERLNRALAARTIGELQELTADLPQARGSYDDLPVPGSQLSAPRAAPTGAVRAGGSRPPARRAGPPELWPQLISWLSVSAICVFIWLVSGHQGSFWPIWVIGPVGIGLAANWARQRGGGGRGPGS